MKKGSCSASSIKRGREREKKKTAAEEIIGALKNKKNCG
jgi:hypothetical protein